MNVKQCNAGYPAKEHLVHLCKERGDTKHLQYKVGNTMLYASCHMDVKPMCLIHSCDTSNPGEPRYRHFAVFDESVGHVYRNTYKLE